MTRGVFVDRTGIRYGSLVAIRHLGYGKWLCRCDCGQTKVVRGNHLQQGRVRSCGCEAEKKRKEAKERSYSNERLFKVWLNMRGRCYNPNNKSYGNYGGRGIVLCDEWYRSYLAFKRWAMENGYNPDAPYGECTIDRIDVNGMYEPSNCRWVDLKEQAANKRPAGERPRRWVPVEHVDAENNKIAEYPSVKAASAASGFTSPQIVVSCRKGTILPDGSHWRYVNKNHRTVTEGQTALFDSGGEDGMPSA